jgi:signal transduction histidine kinase
LSNDTGDQGLYLVQVAATTEEIDDAISRFELDLVVTFALLALALVGSAVLQLRYGLRPLWRLQEGVSAIRRGDTEKIDGEYPQDIAPLAGELNLLIAANRDVVERARTQVGNLAHALKTPLSVIVNEAATDASAFSMKVAEQATIMRDQVSYYLDRARVAVRAGAASGSTEVEPVVEALMRTFEKIYRDREIVFTPKVESGIRFLGERQDLEEMIGNLIDNAGKWAQHEVVVEVSRETDYDEMVAVRRFFRVTIDDDGSGLAPELRQEVTRRGKRLDETKPGSGLGLSIVVDLSALYGGSLVLAESPAHGLRVELRLPKG